MSSPAMSGFKTPTVPLKKSLFSVKQYDEDEYDAFLSPSMNRVNLSISCRESATIKESLCRMNKKSLFTPDSGDTKTTPTFSVPFNKDIISHKSENVTPSLQSPRKSVSPKKSPTTGDNNDIAASTSPTVTDGHGCTVTTKTDKKKRVRKGAKKEFDYNIFEFETYDDPWICDLARRKSGRYEANQVTRPRDPKKWTPCKTKSAQLKKAKNPRKPIEEVEVDEKNSEIRSVKKKDLSSVFAEFSI